ncbi:hypothetical protein [Stenotrophomonas geniculata]|uniref:hypothetical protein n=1 Tax=Stenotrophomonas geniculata TaxID=86188 RepID=UPI00247863A8|nr:hypothetical protein [Stenotrophomonas geniculata]MDH7551830.1 hypothetical protein [Stenotrophomonas geniculata]
MEDDTYDAASRSANAAAFAATRLASALEMACTSNATDEAGRHTLTFAFADDTQHRIARKAWQGYAVALIDRPAAQTADPALDQTVLAAKLALIADASFELKNEHLPAPFRDCLMKAAAMLNGSDPQPSHLVPSDTQK